MSYFYEYLMKTLSFWKINVIFQFLDPNLVIIPNFNVLRRCLTPKWQYVIFLWIFNEDVVILRNKRHISILRPRRSHHTEFQLSTALFDTKVTIWHFYEYLMKTLSFWKMNFIFQLLETKLVIIQILTSVRPFLRFLYHQRFSHCMIWQCVIFR